MVKRALPGDKIPIKVTEIIPRLKDGGAFVKFSHSPDISAKEVEEKISNLLKERPIRPLFNPFRGVQAGLVKGVPWLEDLYRFPLGRLRVEFVPKNPGEEAVELSQETLFSLFRRYGKIADIKSQPWDSKVLPKYAYVDFGFVRDAIMARNCLHGFVVPAELGGGKLGTKLRMSYELRAKPHRIWDWISNHPRIVIPVLVALLTGITVVIFDPIRSFFVKAQITRRFNITNSRLVRWLRKQTSDIFTSQRDKVEQAGLNTIWTHRKDIIVQLKKWLMETSETFIVVQGPRGSGKNELVLEQALKDRRNVLVIDCKPIVEARGESATIKKMAAAVGYRPIFSWANSLSSMADLAVQSTTGVKAGFSETLESQLQKILLTAAGSLTEIALSGRHKLDSDILMPPDTYLETHPEKRPVVVIDNFLYKNDGKTIVYDKIAEWAAALVQSNVAHVIFLTTDSSYSKSLSKSLPDRVFRQAALGDLSPDVAKRFVLSHVENGNDPRATKGKPSSSQEKQPAPEPIQLEELDECIGTLGGRLTDLEFLARRLKAGQSPREAVDEITEQSASEILKMFLLPGRTAQHGSSSERRWSVEQAWYLIKALASASSARNDDASSSSSSSSSSLRYHEVLMADTFRSSLGAPDAESALEGLAEAELISIAVAAHSGRPATIAAGKPVYLAAFRALAGDAVLTARMDALVAGELARIEARIIEKAEAELATLAVMPRQPPQAAGRAAYLLAKLEASQRKVEAYEAEVSRLRKVLAKED